MNRLVLIDGNAILHRAFYALPETLTLKDGSPVNAVYGFTSMLLKVIEDLRPTYLICSFDLPKPTFRDALFEDYRAQRPPTPGKLVSQVEMVKDVVRAFGIPIYEMEGYEADDIIGTLARQARQRANSKEQRAKLDKESSRSTTTGTRQTNLTIGKFIDGAIDEVIIVTGDRDLLQLIDKQIKVYVPIKGLSQAKLYGTKEVEEKYGIKPEQMVDYKALEGDPSDNYPGVKGIGPKTAQRLISKYGTLENIYTTIVKNNTRSLHKFYNLRIKKALQEYKDDALMAKKLAKIVTDVPIKLDLKKAKLAKLANPESEKLFKKLAFKTLWRRIEQMSGFSSKNNPKNDKPKKNKNNPENSDQLSML